MSNSCDLTLSGYDFATDAVKIFPNPATDFVAVQTSVSTHGLKVDLIDVLGKTVLSKTIVQGNTLCVFETDTLYNGLYFLKVASGQETKTFKIIIDK
ncbi:MAG TPA: T9SS type A sorting domain-containing protein [Flavobacterium sp.]|nr:T9SS type A sorting domain-containing protein [Flavobacterium sp.]